MGFLSKVTGSLLGSPSKSSSNSSSQSGYGALPAFQQQAFQSQNTGVQQFINPLNAGNIERFTPLGETADETAAYNLIRDGFTPTAQGLQDDLSSLQNPYLSSVISEINRQGQGQNSVLQQNLSGAGQLNSNRSILGANDIDLSRMNQIGSLLSSNYDTNLNYALNVLPALRAADATGLAGIGQDQRALQYQIQQAPVTALQTQAAINAGFPGTSSSYGTSSATGESKGLLSSIGGGLQGLSQLGGVSGIASLFSSDSRLKKNIKEFGHENGHKIYSFQYKTKDFRDLPDGVFIGVMADDVIKSDPDAVHLMDNGFYAVDYNKIGVRFRHGSVV